MSNPFCRVATVLACTLLACTFLASLAAPAFAASTLVTLLAFDGFDGSGPSPVIADAKGNLFGTTHFGGNGEYGPGTINEMSYTKAGGWALGTLYKFSDGDDGGYPDSNPVSGKDGTLYGTALGGNGGKAPGGLVYALERRKGSWSFQTLYDFQGTGDGTLELYTSLVARGGKVYGVTIDGGNSRQCGSQGCGTLFELRPRSGGGTPWHRRVLFNFSGGSSGSLPTSLVGSASGGVYATIVLAMGATVFRWRRGSAGRAWLQL